MRLTVLWLSPLRWAMDRVLQWVASRGAVSSVSVATPESHAPRRTGNRSEAAAARFVRQSVQPPFPGGSGDAIARARGTVIGQIPGGAPLVVLLHLGLAENRLWPAGAQSLRRSLKTDDLLERTHRSKDHAPTCHPKLAAALVVRLPWMGSSSGLPTNPYSAEDTCIANSAYNELRHQRCY